MSFLTRYAVSILKSYSAVLFNSSVWGGAALLLLTFLNPNVGFGGFVSLISAYLFARLVGFKEEFLRLDYYVYNPLLVGLSLGYLFKLNFLSFLFFTIAGILSFLLTYFISSFLYYYLKLPVLSVPFVVGSSLLYLASSKFSNLFVGSLYPQFHLFVKPLPLPLPVEGYLKSLGAVFFTPAVLGGAVIFAVLFAVSRILVLLSLIGYFSGTLFQALLTGSAYHAFTDTAAFNYILASMAVGGVFLVPSLRSYKFALLASLLAVPFNAGAKVFWESYGLPVFALPFNVTTHLLLYVLMSVNYWAVVKLYKGTPERTLDYYLTFVKRFPSTDREVSLPFSGRWTVWQSFNGEWTHKGPWRYAVDFVITDQEGNTYSGDGYYLTDYYAFGKPVLSPAEGQVVSVVSTLPDNPPGKADRENNWGNYVLIRDKRGFYVLVAHFKQNSIRVKPGDYVVRGTLLGQCGNSGYSPQPHIHIHVQLLPELGAPTVPFVFSSYLVGNLFKDAGVPSVGEVVEPVYPDKSLLSRLNLLIDQELSYSVFEGEKEVSELHLKVKMAPDSTFYLTDGRAKLYFGIRNSTFYFYHFEGDTSSPLKYLFFSAPKIPLFEKQGVYWRDYLPLIAVTSRLKRELYLLLSSFKENLFQVSVKSSWKGRDSLHSDILLPSGKRVEAFTLLSPDYGFEEIRYGSITLKRRR
ncbi:urea transporter [Thermovibrio ammonificans]